MKRLACFTMDIEPDADCGSDIELFARPEQLEAFAAIVERHDLKLTGFLVTRLLERRPELIRLAAERLPLEWGVHSHTHNRAQACSEQEVSAAVAAFTDFFGRPPEGYRAPNGLIDASGLRTLAERGFTYDSSIFPSCRLDRFAYMNLHLPVDPFVFTTPGGDILELPMAVVRGVRLVLSMSYLKLLGFTPYRLLSQCCGLPHILVIDSHPYDFFIHNHLGGYKGWKRWAHSRNADAALRLFDQLLLRLRGMGYEFVHMSEVVRYLRNARLPAIPSTALSR